MYNQSWKRASESCTEHIWANGFIGGFRTLLSIAYLWTGNNCTEENQRVFQCISSDIKDQGNNHEIVILRDKHAHIEYLDGYTYATGNILLDLCEEHDLALVHTEDVYLGKIT